ncbi:MAG: glycosyltransferase [Lachnospiraceae bacterium]|nr:glycosyltransferase [Lachnospiraceae bacterium]
MNDLVTILLPTYNGERYILQMLDSVYAQDYRPIEVILSDDASADRTLAKVNGWLKGKNKDDFLFKVIRNKTNRGLSGNISYAAKYVHGKYLFLADQDDIWKRNKVSVQVDYLKRNTDCEMCVCDRSAVDRSGKIICKSLMRYEHRDLRKRSYTDVLNNEICYSANAICLITKHMDQIFPIPEEICEHDTFIAIMAAHFGKIGYIKEALVLYRVYNGNLSCNYAMETNGNLIKLGYVIVKRLRRKNWKETKDPVIIREVLSNRFNENHVKFSSKIYAGSVDHIYLAAFQYILNNFSKWKRFM